MFLVWSKVLTHVDVDSLQLMASKASSEQMQADQYNVGRTYYYGSGQGDDEDDGGSGSGAGGSGGGSNDHAGVPIKSAYQPGND